jgi:hypothetical protein
MAKNENTESFVRKKMSCEADKEKMKCAGEMANMFFPQRFWMTCPCGEAAADPWKHCIENQCHPTHPKMV